jgi:UDP-N-acetylglucosamine--N-acetylmuramyl-(pentapeptide) pyrophosphoryl-undecaprenol N-acetylglucosamine transferase
MTLPEKTILLAAGGTGGHLYPAEALAQELLDRGHKVVIVTDKRGAAFRKLGDKVTVLRVRAATFKPGLTSKVKAVIDICLGILQSAALLKKFRPAAVVGFGGYPSFPTMFAAQQMGFRTLLHEQNAILGKANLHLADKAAAIATALPDTKNISPANQRKVTVTGNPVREAICAVREKPYVLPSDTFNIFITGGSQGAKILSDIVPEAMHLLPDDIKGKLRIVHQCPESTLAATMEKYKAGGLSAETKSFFDDMPERLSACHLFIGRSGASTVAEIAVVGRPAIFVPLWHADRQQFLNAEQLSATGGAWVMEQKDFSPAALAAKIAELFNNPAALEAAAKAAKACGQPEAVKNLANLVELHCRG